MNFSHRRQVSDSSMGSGAETYYSGRNRDCADQSALQSNNNSVYQFGDHMNQREDYDNDDLCISSPTVWLCEMGREKIQSTCNPFFESFAKPSAVKSKSSPPTSRDMSSSSSLSSWRDRATRSMLSGDAHSDDPDGDDAGEDPNLRKVGQAGGHSNATTKVASMQEKKTSSFLHRLHQSQSQSQSQQQHQHQQQSLVRPLTTTGHMMSNPEYSGTTGESRIVAPHVAKLSPFSVVEVRLHSSSECVAVLCSVDVLKMRSGFFQDILAEQERVKDDTDTPTTGSLAIWRPPVSIPEESPFEAAAFVESLHEGRALFSGEWNMCWARLSVHWVVEEMMLEYAAQIESHVDRLLRFCYDNHWRTSPTVLKGMRVAAFRKGTNLTPTVVLGTVVEGTAATAYSKIRVAFDTDKDRTMPSAASSLTASGSVPSSASHSPTQSRGKELKASPSTPFHVLFQQQYQPAVTPQYHHNHSQQHQQQLYQQQLHQQQLQQQIFASSTNTDSIIGDVSEPFWVQETKEGSVWMEPDEWFLKSAKKRISVTDKRIFWEMMRIVIELPELAVPQNAHNDSDSTSDHSSHAVGMKTSNRTVGFASSTTQWEASAARPGEAIVAGYSTAADGCHSVTRRLSQLSVLSSPDDALDNQFAAHSAMGANAPQLRVRNSVDLAAVMQRPENRLLWTADAPEYLPKDTAALLVGAAYLPPGIDGK